eukprot:765518-Hanusia_phi.AAC.19
MHVRALRSIRSCPVSASPIKSAHWTPAPIGGRTPPIHICTHPSGQDSEFPLLCTWHATWRAMPIARAARRSPNARSATSRFGLGSTPWSASVGISWVRARATPTKVSIDCTRGRGSVFHGEQRFPITWRPSTTVVTHST